MVRLQLDSIAQEAMDLNLAKEGYTAFYVDGTNGRDNYPGDSWEQPFKTIQHAIDEAGAWAKIFIKAGTYAENVTIAKDSMHLVGQSRDSVEIHPASGTALTIVSDFVTIEKLALYSSATTFSADVSGENIVLDTLTLDGDAIGDGIIIRLATGGYSRHVIVNNIYASNSNLQSAITTGATTDVTISNCELNLTYPDDGTVIYMAHAVGAKIFNNTIGAMAGVGKGRGMWVTGTCSDINIFHNNFIGNDTQLKDSSGVCDVMENFYDDHTTDTNNDGLCDTPYAFMGGTDYQPVSRINGWKQGSLGYDSATTNTLVFKGTVTTATDATHFASTDLIGHGNDALKDWYIYVFYDTAGTDAAPQGEQQPITDYVSSTGTFTHTAFTADLAVGDEVLIMHPYEATGGDATEAKQDTIISGQEGGVNDVNRVAGKTQIFEKSITSAANAGNVLIGTITAQPCLIKSVVVHADATGQADLTSAGVYGGVNITTHTLTFLSATDAAKTNIDVADEQVAWTGVARLAATKVIAIELLGTGATTVDLTVIVECVATVNGGYLV